MLNPPQQFAWGGGGGAGGGPEPPIFYIYDNISTHQPHTHTHTAHTHRTHTTQHTHFTHTHLTPHTHMHTPHTSHMCPVLASLGGGVGEGRGSGGGANSHVHLLYMVCYFFVIRYSLQTSICVKKANDSDALVPNGNSNRGLILFL